MDIRNFNDISEHEDIQASGLDGIVASILWILQHEVVLWDRYWERRVLAGVSSGNATCLDTLPNPNSPSRRKISRFIGFEVRMHYPGRSLLET